MYSYPIDYELYSNDEIIIIVEFLAMVEDANNGKVDSKQFIKKYNDYQRVINSKSTEKTIDREYQKVSGYSIFKTIQKYKDQ